MHPISNRHCNYISALTVCRLQCYEIRSQSLQWTSYCGVNRSIDKPNDFYAKRKSSQFAQILRNDKHCKFWLNLFKRFARILCNSQCIYNGRCRLGAFCLCCSVAKANNCKAKWTKSIIRSHRVNRSQLTECDFDLSTKVTTTTIMTRHEWIWFKAEK